MIQCQQVRIQKSFLTKLQNEKLKSQLIILQVSQQKMFGKFIDNPNQSNDSYDIAVGYTSPGQNAVRGITYCEAYSSQTPRCEVYKGFIIDWEYGGAMINDAVGGTIGISLKKTGTESKDIFRKILSTFKFIK